MERLYLECNSGISGDMVTAALLDLGADEMVLKRGLDSLPLEGFRVEIGRVKKAGLDVCDFKVVLDEEHENHDHDMEYLYGHTHGEPHGHIGGHTQGEPHGHIGGHTQGEPHGHIGGHTHGHPGLQDVSQRIRASEISPRAKEIALRIFTILGEAEAKAHGETLETVHFHEVGAVDSIVDIVSAAVCLDNLGVQEVILPFLCEGGGTVRCQHGILPVPVPAVANIAAAYGLTLHLTGEQGEYVTPTGAAIAAAVKTSDQLPDRFVIKRIGLGAGKRNYSRPSILRAMILETEEPDGRRETGKQEKGEEAEANEKADGICCMETNVDDCTGESLGFVMEQLFAAGARDVYYTPIYMKKNRPAYKLSILCDEEKADPLERIVFRETTTIGIRRWRMERTVLEREVKGVHTSMGPVQVKLCRVPGEAEARCYPEYESVAAIAKKSGLSCRQVYDRIVGELEEGKKKTE